MQAVQADMKIRSESEKAMLSITRLGTFCLEREPEENNKM